MTNTTDFCGIKVDVDKLAQGILQMIYEHPDGICLAYGMFPAEIMNALDVALQKKIPNCYNLGDVESVDGIEVRHDITKAVCSKVLELASNQGYLVV